MSASEKSLQARKRASSPAAKGQADPKAKAAAKGPNKGGKEVAQTEIQQLSDVVEGFPPQLCALALGSAGLARAWVVSDALLLPRLLCLASGGFLGLYALKAVLRPDALLRDASVSATVSALGAAPAAAQVLALRLKQEQILGLWPTQLIILFCHCLLLFTAGRFALLNWRKGLWPDPSWFPGLLLSGMTNVSASVVGPEWLKALLIPWFFWLTIVIYVPVKMAVAYRLFAWSERRSVTPNAAMATFMAPGSFFTVVHLSIGKPGGDLMGAMLFADSTLSFLATLVLLWARRALWSRSFHPSYVSFTFPLASTATGALLVPERLPFMASPLLSAYGQLLLYVATAVILAVQVRFIYFLISLRQKKK